jgi:hypothetical protein
MQMWRFVVHSWDALCQLLLHSLRPNFFPSSITAFGYRLLELRVSSIHLPPNWLFHTMLSSAFPRLFLPCL